MTQTAINRLHVYHGPGKGKTTTAMGIALRCLGHGGCVLVGQFMKDGRSGELEALARCGAIVSLSAPVHGFAIHMPEAQKQRTANSQL